MCWYEAVVLLKGASKIAGTVKSEIRDFSMDPGREPWQGAGSAPQEKNGVLSAQMTTFH